MVAFRMITFCIAFCFAAGWFTLVIGFVSGFDRHMRNEHGRSVRWRDLF